MARRSTTSPTRSSPVHFASPRACALNFGDSNTFGEGVNDDENDPWLVAARRRRDRIPQLRHQRPRSAPDAGRAAVGPLRPGTGLRADARGLLLHSRAGRAHRRARVVGHARAALRARERRTGAGRQLRHAGPAAAGDPGPRRGHPRLASPSRRRRHGDPGRGRSHRRGAGRGGARTRAAGAGGQAARAVLDRGTHADDGREYRRMSTPGRSTAASTRVTVPLQMCPPTMQSESSRLYSHSCWSSVKRAGFHSIRTYAPEPFLGSTWINM